jgi:ribosomal protein S2
MFQSIQLINVSAHIGSSKQCWMTLTSRFVSGFRKGITIINLSYTSFHLRRALLFVQGLVSKNGIIIINTLYINTHMYLINRFYTIGQIVAPNDWIGGYLSNYRNLKKKVISKKKSRAFISAIINLNFNIDNRFISSEATNSRLPIISIFDTNSQSATFDFPIPTNNKNSSVRTFYAFLFSSAVFSGLIRKVLYRKKRSLEEVINKVVNNTKFINSRKNKQIFENFSYFNKRKNLFVKKYDYFYIKKIDKFNYVKVSKIIKVLINFKNSKFRIFKKRFLFNDFVTNFDIINIMLDESVENLLYAIRSIKFIYKYRSKFTSKIKLLYMRRRMLLVFSKRRRTEVIASLKYKRFSKKVKRIRGTILGSILKFKKITDIVNLNIYIKVLDYTLFKNFIKKNFPWRVEYLKYKRYSRYFGNILKKHKSIILKKVYNLCKIGFKKFTVKKVKKHYYKKRIKKIFNVVSGGGIEPPR